MSDSIVTASSGSFQPVLVDIPSGEPGVQYAIVPRYEGAYAAGTDGSIWSRKKLFRLGFSQSWHRLNPTIIYGGYFAVTSRQPETGKNRPFPVHVMVTEAWTGPRPDGMFVRHLNGNPKDNRPSNLAWGTQSENMLDRGKHGDPTFRGDGHPMAVLTEDIVIELRARVSRGETTREAAAALSVNIEAAYGAVRGRSWQHLPGAVRTHPRVTSKEEREEIRQLAIQGLTVLEIVDRTGHDYLHVYNAAFRKPRKKRSRSA